MKIFSAIIKYCLANRFLTLALAVITMCGGVSALFKLPVDILPNLDKSITTIVAEAPGYAPEEVEKLVAIPIENALAGLNGVKRIRTANSPSLSLINIDFDWNADTYNMRQLVQERLQTLGDKIPENVSISIAPIASVMGEIIVMSLGSENPNISPIQLRTIAMDFWASIEHQLRYKKDFEYTKEMADELLSIANLSAELDGRMDELRKKIHGDKT